MYGTGCALACTSRRAMRWACSYSLRRGLAMPGPSEPAQQVSTATVAGAVGEPDDLKKRYGEGQSRGAKRTQRWCPHKIWGRF